MVLLYDPSSYICHMLKHCCFALLLLMLLGDKGSFKTDCVLDKGPFKNDDAIGEKTNYVLGHLSGPRRNPTYAYVPKILTHTSQRAEHYIKLRMRMRAHLDTMLTFAAAFVIFYHVLSLMSSSLRFCLVCRCCCCCADRELRGLRREV